MKFISSILIMILLYSPLYSQQMTKNIFFSVHLGKSLQKDSLTLKYWPYMLNESVDQSLPHQEVTTGVNENGDYVFYIKGILQDGYISLTNGVKNSIGYDYCWLGYYYANPGDSIHLSITGDSTYLSRINIFPEKFRYNFSGRGFKKYQCQYHILTDKYNKVAFNSYSASRIFILRYYKDQLEPKAYQVINADMIGKIEYRNIRQISSEIAELSGYRIDTCLGKSRIIFKKYNTELLTRLSIDNVNDSIKSFSIMYSQFLYNYHWLNYKLFYNKRYKSFYDYLKNSLKGAIRDKMLVMEFCLDGKFTKEGRHQVKEALKIVNNHYYLNILNRLLKAHLTGYAYNFSLPDTSGKIIHLSDFIGKVVLLDFWFTGCGACSGYYQHQLKYVENKFKNNKEIVFITVSIDRDKQQWLKSIMDDKYTSPKAVNLFTSGLGANHNVIQEYNITGYPSPLLIDKTGRIYQTKSSELFISSKLINMINKLIRVENSKTMVNKEN